jgi:Flp pilus assembly protein TadD
MERADDAKGAPTIAELKERFRQEPHSLPRIQELAVAFLARGENDEAIRVLTSIQPMPPDLKRQLFTALRKSERFEEAVACFPDEHRSPSVPFWLADRLGELYATVLNRQDEARVLCARAIALKPNESPAYANLARVCVHDVSMADGVRRAEAAAPPNASTERLHMGVATALVQVGRYDDAFEWLSRLATTYPESGQVFGLLGRVDYVLDRHADSERDFAKARAYGNARRESFPWMENLRYLWRTGNYDRLKAVLREDGAWVFGWPPGAEAFAVRDRTVLVKTDPNCGAAIQWSRVVPFLRQAGARAIVECRTPVKGLLERLDGVSQVVVPYDECPAVDEACVAFSLMCSLTESFESLTMMGPYLTAPPLTSSGWAGRVKRTDHRLHIGVAATTTDDMTEDDRFTRRSLPAAQIVRLTSIPGVVCHDLTISPGGLRSHGRQADCLDTADAATAMDLIVTVDTALAHLAGALGKPTLMLLPYFPDWRWGDNISGVLWYPSIRRFQQRAPGDWAPVVADVISEIESAQRLKRAGSIHA